jgi:hypothetical protein
VIAHGQPVPDRHQYAERVVEQVLDGVPDPEKCSGVRAFLEHEELDVGAGASLSSG